MPGDGPGSELFFAYKGQHPVLEHLFRQHLLELAVLPFQLLEPPGFVDLHVPKLPLPPVEGHLREVFLPADVLDAFPAPIRLQVIDNK